MKKIILGLAFLAVALQADWYKVYISSSNFTKLFVCKTFNVSNGVIVISQDDLIYADSMWADSNSVTANKYKDIKNITGSNFYIYTMDGNHPQKQEK